MVEYIWKNDIELLLLKHDLIDSSALVIKNASITLDLS